MIKKNKKGFTLVELLVVIAILAILASVSVVGYLSFTKKAQESNDVSMISQANTILQGNEVLNGKPSTMNETLNQIKNGGLDFEKLNPSNSENTFLWNEETNRFVIYNNDTITYPEKVEKPADNKLWKIVEKYDSNCPFSQYLKDVSYIENLELNINTGLDVGLNTEDFVINYTSNNAKTNIIRTNSSRTNLVVDAPNDTIKHYGKVNIVDLKNTDLNNCYHEYGIAIMIKVNDSKLVIENSSNVYGTHIFSNNAKVEVKSLMTVNITKNEGVNPSSVLGYGKDVTVSNFEDVLADASNRYEQTHPEDNPTVSTSKWSGKKYEAYNAANYIFDATNESSASINKDAGWLFCDNSSEKAIKYKYVLKPNTADKNYNVCVDAKSEEEFNQIIANAKKYVETVENIFKETKTVIDSENLTIEINTADGFAALSMIHGYFSARNQAKIAEKNYPYNPEYYFPGTNSSKSWLINVNCNIDLANQDWNPISIGVNIDFKDHFVTNLTVTNKENAGLFSSVRSKISNLTITNANVTANGSQNSTAGILAGNNTYSVSNVIVRNSQVSNAKYTGGVIGYGYTSVSDCIIEDITIDGLYKTGGIIGYICADNGKSANVTNNTLNRIKLLSTKTLEGKKEEDKCIGILVGHYNCNGSVEGSVYDNIEGPEKKVGLIGTSSNKFEVIGSN